MSGNGIDPAVVSGMARRMMIPNETFEDVKSDYEGALVGVDMTALQKAVMKEVERLQGN